jgi:acid phosphatase family membrane protein YuiD
MANDLSWVDEFIAEATGKPTAHGSPVVALDATASRQPTWDSASHLMGMMFKEVAAIGALEVQAV